MSTVFVIEELVNISSATRHIVAICRSEASVKNWIAAHEGDQLIMLDDGSIVSKYEVTVYEVL